MVAVTRGQVFAWRMRRQFIGADAAVDAVAVAERLGGVQAQVASAAEMAVALRGSAGEPGGVGAGLRAGSLVKTWAMRGTLHALTPDFAAGALSLMASARTWEKGSWVKTFGATPDDVAALVVAVGEILGDAVLTREELVSSIVAERRFQPLEDHLRSGWGALLKPLAWQGALCHGPVDGTTVTFTHPARLISGWKGIPDPDVAAPEVIRTYLGAYGPATPGAFDAWLSRGSIRKPVLRRWFAELGDELTEVEVEGRRRYLRTEHVDELVAIEPEASVRLLGSFDQYVLGPGTNDTALLPAEHRAKVSRAAGWISPLVLVDGRIAGTWAVAEGDVVVSMFDGAAPSARELKREAARVARATGVAALTVRAE
ncbi:winged helix DNA-binding domain-containing protein [Nocardia sp. NPDC005978]|uniref:winged helix DNA-binding domain-containing protein n=1 Tax=Nocardia sp. NPDC005978 TaxID=3156725 RepID=UPI00339F7131